MRAALAAKPACVLERPRNSESDIAGACGEMTCAEAGRETCRGRRPFAKGILEDSGRTEAVPPEGMGPSETPKLEGKRETSINKMHKERVGTQQGE